MKDIFITIAEFVVACMVVVFVIFCLVLTAKACVNTITFAWNLL